MSRPKQYDFETVFSLRMTEDIDGKIRTIAKNEKRSLNSQILVCLEDYIANYEREHGPISTEEQN